MVKLRSVAAAIRVQFPVGTQKKAAVRHGRGALLFGENKPVLRRFWSSAIALGALLRFFVHGVMALRTLFFFHDFIRGLFLVGLLRGAVSDAQTLQCNKPPRRAVVYEAY